MKTNEHEEPYALEITIIIVLAFLSLVVLGTLGYSICKLVYEQNMSLGLKYPSTADSFCGHLTQPWRPWI